MYLFALNTWLKAKGKIIDYVYEDKNYYLLIGFQTEKGETIKFEERGYILAGIMSFYKLNSEVDVLYSPSSPDVAIVNSIISPVVYIGCIVFFIVVYFYF